MITFKEVDKSFLELYDTVSMNVNVHAEYKAKRMVLAELFQKKYQLNHILKT